MSKSQPTPAWHFWLKVLAVFLVIYYWKGIFLVVALIVMGCAGPFISRKLTPKGRHGF